MEEKEENENQYTKLMLSLPLVSCIIREHLWLKKFAVSKDFLKKAIEDPKTFKDFSVLKSIRTADIPEKVQEQIVLQNNTKSQENTDKQLKLYKDFQWSKVPEYYWPIYPGDYSPLSPDGEFLERHGKIGVDFWRWNRETSPLGYIPPLCTCKKTEECVKYLRRWSINMKIDFDYKVCENEVCRGLLYIPYSLIEVPLNRVISNGSEFALKVKVPNSTDVYCGNMKHTIILCTTSKKHEQECLEAIEGSLVSSFLVYDVYPEDLVPYFKKYNEDKGESPIMSLEPIDSEVSDPGEDYGLGQIFAIKRLNDNLLIEKYDINSKTTSPIDYPLLETWNKMSKPETTKEEVKEGEKENVKPEQEQEEDKESKEKPTKIKREKSKEKTEESSDQSEVRKELEKQEYQVYELIESFSYDRRPLHFRLRDYPNAERETKRDKNDKKEEPPKPKRKCKLSDETLQSIYLLNTLSKF